MSPAAVSPASFYKQNESVWIAWSDVKIVTNSVTQRSVSDTSSCPILYSEHHLQWNTSFLLHFSVIISKLRFKDRERERGKFTTIKHVKQSWLLSCGLQRVLENRKWFNLENVASRKKLPCQPFSSGNLLQIRWLLLTICAVFLNRKHCWNPFVNKAGELGSR